GARASRRGAGGDRAPRGGGMTLPPRAAAQPCRDARGARRRPACGARGRRGRARGAGLGGRAPDRAGWPWEPADARARRADGTCVGPAGSDRARRARGTARRSRLTHGSVRAKYGVERNRPLAPGHRGRALSLQGVRKEEKWDDYALPGRGPRDLPNRFWHVADLEARAARRTVASRHLSDPPGGRRDPSPSRGAIGSEAPDASLRASRLGSAGDRLTSARLLDGIAGV